MAPPVTVNIPSAPAKVEVGALVGRVELPAKPQRPSAHSQHQNQRNQQTQHNYPRQPKKQFTPRPPMQPGELLPLNLRRIALRKTCGHGLGSGQLLVRTQYQWKYSKAFDFVVTDMFLPTTVERKADGLVLDHTSYIPFNSTIERGDRANWWVILQIRVGEDGKPWIRSCQLSGLPYGLLLSDDTRSETEPTPWEPMDTGMCQLRMHKPEHLAAVREFTGLDYDAWDKNPKLYDQGMGAKVDVAASVLMQQTYLS